MGSRICNLNFCCFSGIISFTVTPTNKIYHCVSRPTIRNNLSYLILEITKLFTGYCINFFSPTDRKFVRFCFGYFDIKIPIDELCTRLYSIFNRWWDAINFYIFNFFAYVTLNVMKIVKQIFIAHYYIYILAYLTLIQ